MINQNDHKLRFQVCFKYTWKENEFFYVFYNKYSFEKLKNCNF